MHAENLLEKSGVRPTANRILVARELLGAHSPLSLIDLEHALQPMDRSSILRVLTLLHQAHIVHAMEDGRGVVRYEVCSASEACSISDMHPHFYCERCERVFCFESMALPQIAAPDGFQVDSVNFMLKGVCPDCASHPKES